MEQQRDFKGIWISKEIWLDERLNALEKVILMEIDSLDNEETGCYASNEYLAEFCQCSVTKISTAISKLINLGYISMKSFNGRTRILKSRLSKIERQTCKNLKADLQNLKDNNIYNNIIEYNKEKIEKRKFIPPTLEEIQSYIEERNSPVDAQQFYDYFNTGNWVDSNGNKVKNWKQKLITWEKYTKDQSKKKDNFYDILNSIQ